MPPWDDCKTIAAMPQHLNTPEWHHTLAYQKGEQMKDTGIASISLCGSTTALAIAEQARFFKSIFFLP